MLWTIRIVKLGLIAGGVLIFGWLALGVVAALVLLALLLNAEDAFWSGMG